MTGVRLHTPRLTIRDLPPAAAGRVARFHHENWHFHRTWEPHRDHGYFTEQVQRRILRDEARSATLLHLWLLPSERTRTVSAPGGEASTVLQRGTHGSEPRVEPEPRAAVADGGRAPRRWRRRAIIGSVTLSSIVYGFFQSCYLGYKMDARYTRRGLMTEALTAVIEHAFTTMGLHRLEANVMPRNEASKGLLVKLGFHDEGIAKRYLQIQGRWEDHTHMVMLREEWEESKNTCRG